MKKENATDELWLQKEVIEYLRCASSSFFTAKRYEVLYQGWKPPQVQKI